VAVLVIAIIALRHPGARVSSAGTLTHPRTTAATSHSTPAPSTSSRRSTPPPSQPSVQKLPLVVLNNSTISGLAERAQTTFQAGGWTVTSIGNLDNEIISTCAYYDPATAGAQASAAALRAQFPAIKRVEPKFDGLPAGPIVVVLTSDYASG
jgi:hypothetical protein